jgi:hypothetical protein
MNKRAVLIVVTVLVLGAIVGVLFMKNPAKAPSESGTSTTTNSQKTSKTAKLILLQLRLIWLKLRILLLVPQL